MSNPWKWWIGTTLVGGLGAMGALAWATSASGRMMSGQELLLVLLASWVLPGLGTAVWMLVPDIPWPSDLFRGGRGPAGGEPGSDTAEVGATAASGRRLLGVSLKGAIVGGAVIQLRVRASQW